MTSYRNLDQWIIEPVTGRHAIRVPDQAPASMAALMLMVRKVRKTAGSPSWHAMFLNSRRAIPAAVLRDLTQANGEVSYRQLCAILSGCGAGGPVQRWFLAALATLLNYEEEDVQAPEAAASAVQPEPGEVSEARSAGTTGPPGLPPGADPGPYWR